MKEFKVTAIPAVWIIGADGKVVWNSGEKTNMEDALKKAIAAAKSG
ncbi:MAG: hypothetical protein IID45_15180 [Planctomycetes bacterium]|nr:hypothetical protein [Planctomycetota bacterium]